MESRPYARSITAKCNTLKPLEVQSILANSGATAAKPSPVEHVASPTSPPMSARSGSSGGGRSFQSHSRSMTMSTEASSAFPGRSSRFSLQFPVQPATIEQSPTRSTSPIREIAAAIAPEHVAAPTGPTDSSFLTAIATQERRVLELKEELQRAEADLNKLKRQWASHEAQKKKNDVRKVTKLQSLNTSLPSADKEEDSDGSSAWIQHEMERRKALLNGTRNTNRTVFSGSRHTRALSLLSPVQRSNASFEPKLPPPRKESLPPKSATDTDVLPQPLGLPSPPRARDRPRLMARASTTPDLTTEVAEHADSEIDLRDKGIDRDMLINSGKKIATDFKDGLWTFLEDLRQATVGDEATQIPPPHLRNKNSAQNLRTAQKKGSKSSLRPTSRGSTTAKVSTNTTRPERSPTAQHRSPSRMPEESPLGAWAEQPLGIPSAQATPAPVKKGSMHRKTPSKAVSIASSDAWDTWPDSPGPAQKDSRSSSSAASASSIASEATTVPTTASASPRPSLSSIRDTPEPWSTVKKDPIPWPALSKFGPATLRRTASHLMNEWERSLTPPPAQGSGGGEDYLGLSAEAAAVSPAMARRTG